LPHPAKHPDLHGNVPDDCAVTLVIVDALNTLDFEGHEAFVPLALRAGRQIAGLKERAARAGIPVVYVNDNAGRWRSDVASVVSQATRDEAPGKELTRLLVPSPADYVVLKPKHSGFYSTPLDTLLTYLGTERLILTGLTVERCLLFTANDAFLRDYELFVPRDCTAAIDQDDYVAALRILERVLQANTESSERLNLEALKAKTPR
jgi:nicotinamidase-related amidase